MISDLTANRFPALTPFQESITYFARNYVNGIATDSYTQYRLPQSRSRELNKKDVEMNPQLLNTVELVFEIWKPIMNAVGMSAPTKNDYLVDKSGVGWTVEEITGKFHQNNYYLFCIRKV